MTKSEWISVEDGLPEQLKRVWINRIKTVHCDGYITVGWYGRNNWFDFNKHDFISSGLISHWMPLTLPQPPEVKG